MKNKKIDTQLVTKCDIKGVPSNKLHRQNEVFEPFSFRRMLDNKDIYFVLKQDDFAEKTKEVEELGARISKENQALIEHNANVQKFTTGTDILQVIQQ
jgi:hypothetical protein